MGEVNENQEIHFTPSAVLVSSEGLQVGASLSLSRSPPMLHEWVAKEDSEDASRKDQLLNFQVVIATVADDSNPNTISSAARHHAHSPD